MIHVVLFALGIVALWGGTLLTIRGAVQFSEDYGLSQGFVGLSVLAIGTDLPELVVALSGSAQRLQGIDASGMIVGTAVGSAIAQATLVLGVAGLLAYLPVGPRMVRRDGMTLLLVLALTTALAFDGRVGRLEGAVMLLAYGIYSVALVQAEQRRRREAEALMGGRFPTFLAIGLGLVTLTLGAHVVVTEGILLAATAGVSQTLLGLVFVGTATSLPELALSVQAARQKRASLSIGNVIGSNIFDLLVPVGAAAALHPLTVDNNVLFFDLPALALVTVALLYFLKRRRGLQRNEAVALLVLYGLYAVARVVVG